MSAPPTVAKTIWTDADFATMSWHDNAVHAIALEPARPDPGRLLLDIDYIVHWVPPEAPATTLSFWICPATLVFDQAWDLTTDIDLRGWSFQLSLNAIERATPAELTSLQSAAGSYNAKDFKAIHDGDYKRRQSCGEPEGVGVCARILLWRSLMS